MNRRPVPVLCLVAAAAGFFGSQSLVAVDDKSTAAEVKDLLPPEILRHYETGEYKNPVVDFPAAKFRWDDGFDEATKRNAETLVLDENKQPVDKTTKERPEYIQGLPFPNLREDDPDGGSKIIWNLFYAYYAGVFVVAALLGYEQSLLLPIAGPFAGDRVSLDRLDKAFFDVNGWVSLGFLALVAIDVALWPSGAPLSLR